jgi:UTP--glucose-1-phosphate uridylyltransferase
MATSITSVVIPAAGRGTRLLPATKTTPKELLNVYDRPALQFAIDEAIDLGVERIVVVTHPDKVGIRDYLTPDPGYVQELRDGGKAQLGDVLSEIEVPDRIEIVFAEQRQPLGLGHAILCAEGLTLPGAFGVILPDDLILGTPCLSEMARHYVKGHMIAAMEVRPDETSSYGIFRTTGLSIGRTVPVSGMVEKPPRRGAIAAGGCRTLHSRSVHLCHAAACHARGRRRDPVDRRDRARRPERHAQRVPVQRNPVRLRQP